MKLNKLTSIIALSMAACMPRTYEERVAKMANYDFVSKVEFDVLNDKGERKLLEAYDTDASKRLLEAMPGQETDIAFLLDFSGSMDEKIENKKGERVSKSDVVKNFPFPINSDVYVFSSSLGKEEGKHLKEIQPDDRTPLMSSLYQVLNLGQYKKIVVITDGENNSEIMTASDVVNLALLKKTKISIVPVGLNKNYLSTLEALTKATGGELKE